MENTTRNIMETRSQENPTDIEKLIWNASRQHENLQLEVQFQKNMDFFKKSQAGIHKHFIGYNPEDLKLMYTESGYVNLVNYNLDNKPVYQEDPKDYCKNYIERFIEKPTHYKISAKTTKTINEEQDAHVSKMNKAITLLHSTKSQPKDFRLGPCTNFMMMLGVGLGYQIEILLQKTDIRHLIIIEPHEDIFYAALHTIDWAEMHDHFSQENRSLSYIIGQTPDKTFDILKLHLARIGIHNVAKPYIYDHLSSQQMQDTAKTFFDKVPLLLTALGYFDDERTSLAHTVNNYKNDVPVLRGHPLIDKQYSDLPVFIIGNGPSLDSAADFLQNNKDNAVIISCGTALGSLKKMGIKPDFHVEMERTRPVVEWIENSTDEVYRKNIILMALNTVHPKVFSLFNRKGMGLKSNDLGTHYLSQFIAKNQHVINLAFSNPTVINAGAAFSASLGFSRVYLIGADLGFSAGAQHHSKLSTHYDIKDEHVEGLGLYKHDNEGNITVEGNFGGDISTTVTYNSSRHAMEKLIDQDKNIKYFNTSNGILIHGAQPTPYERIELDKIENKEKTTQALFKEKFHNQGLKKIQKKQIQNDFKNTAQIFDQLINVFSSPPKTTKEAHFILDMNHKLGLQIGLNSKTQYTYSLIKGSIHSFNLMLAKCLYNCATDEEGLALFYQVTDLYKEFLEHAKDIIKTRLLNLDIRSRDLDKKISS